METISHDDLKEQYGFTDEQIWEMDQEAQKAVGKTFQMVHTALMDQEQTHEERCNLALMFINVCMEQLEKNFENYCYQNIEPEEIN